MPLRLARITSDFEHSNRQVDQLVETTDLDVLQLDYQWPATLPIGSQPWKSDAAGFSAQIKTLHKTLYLNPRLHVITNAGGGNTQRCLENLAEYLCAHDDQDMPITAVRGDNLLARLEELQADGVELRDAKTNTALPEFPHPILAAHVELGAGPLATALDEGSRIVVAGSYDVAAPAIAAATSGLQWTWQQLDHLAKAAVATCAPHRWIEVEANGEVSIYPASAISLDAEQIFEQMHRFADAEGIHPFADIQCCLQSLRFNPQKSGAVSLSAMKGQTPTGQWRLRVTCRVGYIAGALLALSEPRISMGIKKTVDLLKSRLAFSEAGSSDVHCDLLANTTKESAPLVHIWCKSHSFEFCQAWLREVANYSAERDQAHRNLVVLSPQVVQETKQVWCDVPRDSIAVSVDTRPANEWR